MAKKTAKKSAKKAVKKTAASTKKVAARKAPAKKTAAKSAPRAAAKKKTAARKPNAAFMAPMTPSDALAGVVGAEPKPRTEVTRLLWQYIKKNKLQDPKNARMIRADAALKPVFGGKAAVNMFEMTKLVNQHLS